MKSTKTFSQLFPLKGLKLACLTPILRLKEEQVFHIHVSRLAFLHPPTLKKGSQKVSKTINKLHNCPCGLFIRPLAKREHPNEHLYLIWQQKKITGKRFSDDSENCFKKFKWPWKKSIYTYLNTFYKYSLHTTDLPFQLQFTEYFYLFVEKKNHEHCMEQLEYLSRNIILTLSFTVQNLYIIPIRPAHKLKYKNRTSETCFKNQK